MRVRFLTNIGSNDSHRHGLDFRQCMEGMELTVDPDIGTQLVHRRLADELVSLKAVPPIEIKAAHKAVEKPEPKQDLPAVAPAPVVAPKQEQPDVTAPQPVVHPKKHKDK